MPINRLSQIEENLEVLQEQLGGKEQALFLAREEDKTLIKQLIRKLRKEIREQEKEYWQVLAQQTPTMEISEQEAEIIVAEIVNEVGQIEVQREYPDEMVRMLQQIRDKLNQPAPSAATKFITTFSAWPPFVGVSVEKEFNAEDLFQRHFPTFRKWAKVLAKKS